MTTTCENCGAPAGAKMTHCVRCGSAYAALSNTSETESEAGDLQNMTAHTPSTQLNKICFIRS